MGNLPDPRTAQGFRCYFVFGLLLGVALGFMR
jgi:hypothetical protein